MIQKSTFHLPVFHSAAKHITWFRSNSTNDIGILGVYIKITSHDLNKNSGNLPQNGLFRGWLKLRTAGPQASPREILPFLLFVQGPCENQDLHISTKKMNRIHQTFKGFIVHIMYPLHISILCLH